jgi:uncharacterized protein DUF4382
MGLTFAENSQPLCRNCLKLRFRAVLLFAVWLTGCNNTCFTFTSNPPTGTIGIKVSDPKPTCTLTTGGAVRLAIQTVPVCSSCSDSIRIQHIFVSIRSIDVHPSSSADDDSLDWQELAPQLAKRPLQVDLVAGIADRGTREALGESVAIPAGIYREVRVRFVPNSLVTEDQLPEKNACGNSGFSCVVMADGRIQPLLLDSGSPELRIMSDRIAGGSLFIPLDTNTYLIIELKPVWAWFSSADQGLRLLPALTGSAKVGRVAFDELGTPEDRVVHDSLPRLAHD